MSVKKEVKIGFWYSEHEPALPMPVATNQHRDTTIHLLRQAQNYVHLQGRVHAFRGWSTCRICGAHNGSQEFEIVLGSTTYSWPEGLLHYFVEHKIKRPPELADLFRSLAKDRLRRLGSVKNVA